MRPTSPRTLGTARAADPSRDAACPLQVLPIDVEPATSELISLWLARGGWRLHPDAKPGERIALILVELAFPRRGERQRLQALSEVWPGVPVIVLSPTFFADVPVQGDVARTLGVAGVLATPVRRERLLAAVRAAVIRDPP